MYDDNYEVCEECRLPYDDYNPCDCDPEEQLEVEED